MTLRAHAQPSPPQQRRSLRPSHQPQHQGGGWDIWLSHNVQAVNRLQDFSAVQALQVRNVMPGAMRRAELRTSAWWAGRARWTASAGRCCRQRGRRTSRLRRGCCTRCLRHGKAFPVSNCDCHKVQRALRILLEACSLQGSTQETYGLLHDINSEHATKRFQAGSLTHWECQGNADVLQLRLRGGGKVDGVGDAPGDQAARVNGVHHHLCAKSGAG